MWSVRTQAPGSILTCGPRVYFDRHHEHAELSHLGRIYQAQNILVTHPKLSFNYKTPPLCLMHPKLYNTPCFYEVVT